MPTQQFVYEVRYEFLGRDVTQPFASPKSDAQVESALDDFRNDVLHSLPDRDAEVASEPSRRHPGGRRFDIRTSESASYVESIVLAVLKAHQLCGDAVPGTKGEP